MINSIILVAAVIVGTWNGNWFPSGRAEHRAHPDVEEATITAAAKMLADGLDRIDPQQTNEVVLCLNEIRGPREASNLIARIARPNLRIAAVSAYRRRDRFDQQQDVIATTLPIASASWSKWRQHARETPPRGYAYAALLLSPATTAHVYSVHLKSNYGATTPELAELNRLKRTHAIEQIVDQESPRTKRHRKARKPVIVAGDMNADRWRKEFAKENIFAIFDASGFTDIIAILPPFARGTHPSKTYGNSSLDYIFVRDLTPVSPPVIVPNEGLSDHWAVFSVVR